MSENGHYVIYAPIRSGKPLAKMSGSFAGADLRAKPRASPARGGARLVGILRAEVRGADDQLSQSHQILDLIARKVQSFGGRVEAIKGSQLVATFGVYPCEEPASRAADTAITVSKAAARTSAPGLKPATVQIGIHACEVSVRRGKGSFAIDEEQRQQAEGVLEAILGSAAPEAMVVSQSAARLLQGQFDLEPGTAGSGDARAVFHLVGHRRPGRSITCH